MYNLEQLTFFLFIHNKSVLRKCFYSKTKLELKQIILFIKKSEIIIS